MHLPKDLTRDSKAASILFTILALWSAQAVAVLPSEELAPAPPPASPSGDSLPAEAYLPEAPPAPPPPVIPAEPPPYVTPYGAQAPTSLPPASPPEPQGAPSEEYVASEPALPDVASQPVISPKSEVAVEDFDPRIPRFTRKRPYAAWELAGSLKAFRSNDLDPRQAGTHPTRAVTLSVQLQPTFLQSLGVFSFGPAFSLYPIPTGAAAAPSYFAIWGVGGQAQYQARFFREQILVPVAGYSGEYMKYHFNNGPAGSLTTRGPYFGAYFLLNAIEPRAASDFYANHGVLRSYLVAEVRKLEGTSTKLSVGGNSVYFGFRIEH